MKCQATLFVSLFAATVCIGCNSSPGKPGPDSEVIPPDQIMEFNILYAGSCGGCHGSNGKGGAAVSLSDPVFRAKNPANSPRTALDALPTPEVTVVSWHRDGRDG